MLDYNSDREGHVGHTWVVSQAEQAHRDGVMTSKGLLKFDEQGRFAVKDPALAHEIRTNERNRVAVTRFRTPHASDRGHRYHFGSMPALPWAKYDEFGRRIHEVEDGQEPSGD